MKIKLLILGLFVSSALNAEISSAIVLANFKSVESPVCVVVPAQYLSAEIRIESNEDDWGVKLAGIDEARRLLIEAAGKEAVRVKIDRALVFTQHYSSFSFSKSSGHDALSDVLLLAPLDDRTNLIQVVKKFQSIIAGMKPAKRVSVSLGSIFLAVEDPESYRSELLKKIRAHVDSTAKAVSDGSEYSISGLDEPVQVRQSGERAIEIYIPFRVVYSQKRNGG